MANFIALIVVIVIAFGLIFLLKRWTDGPNPWIKREDGKYDLKEREKKILEEAKRRDD